MRDRFVRFYNLPELMAVFREVADIKTADMLDIPGLPAVRSGKAEIVSVEATPAQQAIMADFILRAEAIRTGRVKPEEDNMLKLTGEARLMAIDPRLIRPDADGTGSKLNVCIEDVYQVWKDTAASASTQLVFCDVGTPKAGKFNVYDEIRNVLLAKGVPESEIAFVHDATSEAQRQELFERTRQGKVRITMAFLLIGNIPLLYFLNKDWYDVLVNTGFGKGILAVCLLVLLISFAAVIRLTKPVEYKR